MRPDTVLIPTGCDVRRLPLDASEAFLLSRLDGELTLEEIGEIAGLGFDKARRLAERLVILGAVRAKGTSAKPPVGAGSASNANEAPKRRIDPRVEAASLRPPRVETVESTPKSRRSMRPATKAASPRPAITGEVKKRRSTKSMKAQRLPASEDVCELDDTTQEQLLAMDAKLRGATHYEVLDVGRDADKKEIRRAYFALAAIFHPDRFFGKKLGAMGPKLDRVFVRITEANDVLGSKQRREEYDATLPPPSVRILMTNDIPAKVELERGAETPKKASKPAPRLSPMPRRPSKRLRRSGLMGAVDAAKPDSKPLENDREKFQRLQAAAKLMAAHTRADALVKAAEDALKANDIIGAANNYRLALQMHDDPIIKDKLAAIDAHSRDLRSEKYLTKARAAERAERWEEAAEHYIRANDARKDGAVAERAANALRLSKGDLRQATALAEQAVTENGKNAEYRVTLGEVLMAASLLVRAKEECEEALSLAPSNPRAKSLAAALKKT